MTFKSFLNKRGVMHIRFRGFFNNVHEAIQRYDDDSVLGAAKAGFTTILFYPCVVLPALGTKIAGMIQDNDTCCLVGLIIGGILTIPIAAVVIVPSLLAGACGALFGLVRTLFSKKDDTKVDAKPFNQIKK